MMRFLCFVYLQAAASEKPNTKDDNETSQNVTTDTGVHSHLPESFETGSPTCKSPNLPPRKTTGAPRGRPRKNSHLYPSNESKMTDGAKSSSPKKKRKRSESCSPDKVTNSLLAVDSRVEVKKVIGGDSFAEEMPDDSLNIIEEKGDRVNVVIEEGEKVHLQDASGSDEDVEVDVGGDDDDDDGGLMMMVAKDTLMQGILEGESEIKEEKTFRHVENLDDASSKEVIDGNGKSVTEIVTGSTKLETEQLSSVRTERNKPKEVYYVKKRQRFDGGGNSETVAKAKNVDNGTEEMAEMSSEASTGVSMVTLDGENTSKLLETKLVEEKSKVLSSEPVPTPSQQIWKNDSNNTHGVADTKLCMEKCSDRTLDIKVLEAETNKVPMQPEQLQEQQISDTAKSEKMGSVDVEVQLPSVNLESAPSETSDVVSDGRSTEAEELEPDEETTKLEGEMIKNLLLNYSGTPDTKSVFCHKVENLVKLEGLGPLQNSKIIDFA